MSDTVATLFQEYIRICNAALDANKHCYPYDRVIREIENRLCFHAVHAAVYDEDGARPEIFFELKMHESQIVAKSCHKPHAKKPWRISRHYLEEVTQHPQSYITDPAQLNWAWLNNPVD